MRGASSRLCRRERGAWRGGRGIQVVVVVSRRPRRAMGGARCWEEGESLEGGLIILLGKVK